MNVQEAGSADAVAGVTAAWIRHLREQGWGVLERACEVSRCDAIPAQLPAHAPRRPLDVAVLQEMALDPRVTACAALGLKDPPRMIRALLLDKDPQRNWAVPWHQDLALAFAAKHDLEGFSAWSCKDGVIHAHGPAWLSCRRIAVRLHLDDCGMDNAPLQIIPGSHRHGPLDDAGVAQLLRTRNPLTITARRGEALVLHPLLLHASRSAQHPRRRRVLHLEYSDTEPPLPLRWQDLTRR